LAVADARARQRRRRRAQFAFHRERLDAVTDRVALVVSAASAWSARGSEATAQAAVAQCRSAFGLRADEALPLPGCAHRPPRHLQLYRRTAAAATRHRPPVGGRDYMAGPCPATLEAAVQAGEAALPLAR
jgi:hypothetical protein